MKKLKDIIKQLNAIIALLEENPKDPTVNSLLLKVQVDLAKTAQSIIGGGENKDNLP